MVKIVSQCFHKPKMTYLMFFPQLRYIQLNKLTNKLLANTFQSSELIDSLL